jgi:hypothetical protein
MKAISVSGGSSPVTPLMVVKALVVAAAVLVIAMLLVFVSIAAVIRLLVGDSMF